MLLELVFAVNGGEIHLMKTDARHARIIGAGIGGLAEL